MTFERFWWEAEYYDRTLISEATGARYRDIDRQYLHHFRLRDNTGPIAELSTEGDRTGWNLVWRRRQVKDGATTKIIYLLGWVPQGPIIVVDPAIEKVYRAETFIPGHPMLYPPVQYKEQGEKWTVPNAVRLLNPAAERTD